MDLHNEDFLTRIAILKERNPGLQLFISVGGWNAMSCVFSQMAAVQENRKVFIASVIAFLQAYHFDGLDIDWEYPAAEHRGGNANDTYNYVSLLHEFRAAVGDRFGLSVVLPASYGKLRPS